MITIVKADGGLCGEHYINRDGEKIGLVYLSADTYPKLHGKVELYRRTLFADDLIQIGRAVKEILAATA